ncbi:hypothetical protein ABZ570_32625 [Micromonospora sp. NPDC007271]|uniref:lipopolysaccharide biosynthesis protein n=1 Tax=Micromonospora sp. NPDC007271 TaxID=3154587 RepID=UPI0034014C3C
MTVVGHATTTAGPRPTHRGGLRTTALLMAPQMATAAASLLINVLAARTLGPAGRGQIALLLQVGYLTNLCAQAGTDRAYPVLIPPGRTPLAALADTLRLVTPTGLLVVAAAVPVVAVVGADTGDGIALTVVVFVVAAAAMVTGGAVRTAAAASGTAVPFAVGALTGQVVLIAAACALTTAEVDSAAGWLAAYAAALTTAPALSWLLLRRRTPPIGPSPAAGLRQARQLGLRLLPAGLASLIMLRADRLFLPWLGSYEQLGLYIVVATVGEFAVWPVQSWVDANAARWHRQHLAGTLNRTRPLAAACGYGLTAAAALIGAGRLLVPPVFGDDYRDATNLLLPLAAGTFAYAVSRVAVGLGVATGRARSALIADIPAMLIAVAAYLLLIPHSGAYGAAVGSAIAYAAGALLALAALTTGRPEPAR